MADQEKNITDDVKQTNTKVKRSLFRKIVNVFIGIFLGLILLSLILLGYTQTKTFRETLREKIISLVNEEINGKLNIEKLNGTIFTSLFLQNTSVLVGNDTLFYARNVELKISPLQILLKKIYVRKILLEDVKIAMLQDSTGAWNFSKLIKPKPEDTTKSSFPFFVQVNDLQLHNVQFIRQSYTNYKSQQSYPTMNMNDLRINNLHFNAQAFVDVDNSNYLLILKGLSFKPNLTRFNLKNISGEFAIAKNFASINNLYFLTDSSELKLNARIDSLNLFGKVQLEDFKNYPVTINANAKSFNFDDLSSFIGSTEILKGNPSMELKARGKFGNFKIEKLAVDYRNTHFRIEGKVLHLNSPRDLFIQAKVYETDFSYEDVNALLPTLKLPEYALLHMTGINIEFDGQPTNFKTKFLGNIENGKVSFDASINVSSNPITYNINFETNELDLAPVIKTNTSLTSKGSLIGKGVSPADINADFKFNANNSSFNGHPLDKFTVNVNAANRIMDLSVDGLSNNASALVKGNISFDKDTIPSYNLVGQLKKLNLATFLKDQKYDSNLNFYFSADGKNFDPDKLTGSFSFGVDSSRFRGKKIDYSNIQCVFKKDLLNREILLTSDFVDFKIDGDFSLKKAISLISYETTTISGIIAKKVSELNPISIVSNQQSNIEIDTAVPDIVNENLKFNYDFKFKDFELIAMLLGNDQLDISGNGKGIIKNENGNFSVSNEMKLDYLVMMQDKTTIYLSDIDSDINFTRDNNSLSFDKLFGTASLTGKRFYSGSNIKSISADITFNQSKLFFSGSANIEDMIFAEADGMINMTPNEQLLSLNKLSATYDGLEWSNKDTVKILFNPDFFKILQFTVQHDTSTINLDGIIERSGNQNLNITASRISGNLLERYLLGYKDNLLIANGSLNGRIEGRLENPVMKILFDLKDLQISSSKLGSIKGSLNYSDKKLTTDFEFLDLNANEQKPLLTLKGSLPIDLSLANVSKRFVDNEPFSIKLKSDNFDLSSLGRIIPGITDQRGILFADVDLSGSFKDPIFKGFINLTDGRFKSLYNNLDYSCSAKIHFENQEMKLDDMTLSNAGGSKYSGTIYGAGGISFNGFSLKDMDLHFNGNLAVLGQQSQMVSPNFYGDLIIGSDGDWILSKPGNRILFKGNFLMENTDLVYTTQQANGELQNKNFNFIFIQDSTKIDRELALFQKVLLKEKALQEQSFLKTEKPLNFDYEIGISADNSAKLVFILSQAANQKLFVEMRGDLKYSSYGGESRVQGAFELLQGSKLEFFKTFEATGFIRFENDVTNPYLDIVATYTSDYIDPRGDGKPQDVAIKIKIKSPLSELGKSLAGNTESIGVYVGTRNIQNNIRDARYDYADAFSFILIGKFKDDLTAQDKAQVAGQTNAIGSTATSFLGSVLTNFLNSQVGDLVNNIQINQSGEYTKFSLSGRIQNLRYSFGGTTEVFQNINKANIKVEYLFNPKFLIRLERKDPIVTSFGLDEKINEMALKYKFEF
ncbi:MAG: hypothetical protein FIA82_03550 [Melioribacter sp.]|nr:hypothetical protein [Melioribacter sp.]